MKLTRRDDFQRIQNPIGGELISVQLTVECDGNNAQALGASTVKDSVARHIDNPRGRHRANSRIASIGIDQYTSAEVCIKANGANRDAYTYYTDTTPNTICGKTVNGAEVAGVTRAPGVAFAAGDWMGIEVLPDTPAVGQNTIRVYKNDVQVGADIVDNGTTFGGAAGSGAILVGGSYGLSLFGTGEISEWEGIDYEWWDIPPRRRAMPARRGR